MVDINRLPARLSTWLADRMFRFDQTTVRSERNNSFGFLASRHLDVSGISDSEFSHSTSLLEDNVNLCVFSNWDHQDSESRRQ
jgi:hypothetical protein